MEAEWFSVYPSMVLWLLDGVGAGPRFVCPTEVERRRHEVDCLLQDPVFDIYGVYVSERSDMPHTFGCF